MGQIDLPTHRDRWGSRDGWGRIRPILHQGTSLLKVDNTGELVRKTLNNSNPAHKLLLKKMPLGPSRRTPALQRRSFLDLSSGNLKSGGTSWSRTPPGYINNSGIAESHRLAWIGDSSSTAGSASASSPHLSQCFLGACRSRCYLVHFQVLCSLGAGLFLWLQQTIVGSFAASPSLSLAIVFVVYICTAFALASTVFFEVDRKAIAVSRAFAVRIVR